MFDYLIFLSFLIPGNIEKNKSVNLDELKIDFFVDSAQLDDRVLFCFLDKAVPYLRLFNFSTGRTQEIDKSQMVFILPSIQVFDNQFLIIPFGHSRGYYLVDRDGQYITGYPFNEFSGWINTFQLTMLSYYQDDIFLGTIEYEKEGLLLLVLLDFKKKELHTWHQVALHGSYNECWVTEGKNIYFFTAETGSLLELDPENTMNVKEIIRQPDEPIRKSRHRPGRRAFRSILSQPLSSKGVIQFRYVTLGEGNEPLQTHVKNLTLSNNTVRESGLRNLGNFNGYDLNFSWKEKAISFSETRK